LLRIPAVIFWLKKKEKNVLWEHVYIMMSVAYNITCVLPG
jgi:hypothetical protein